VHTPSPPQQQHRDPATDGTYSPVVDDDDSSSDDDADDDDRDDDDDDDDRDGI